MKIAPTLAAFFCFVNLAYSQNETLFKIVTFSDGASIDGKELIVGDDITRASKNISIPKNGCVGVVTADGFAYELLSSIPVADVVPFIRSKQGVNTGAMHRPYPMPLTIVLNSRPHAPILGDTLFLSWEEYAEKDRLPGIEYTIKIQDSYGVFNEQKIEHNWILLSMKPYFEKTSMVAVEVISKRTRSSEAIAVTMDDTENKKLRTDIERLGNNSDLALLTSVLDLNGYGHDRNFLLYKMMIRHYKMSGILATYVGRLTIQLDLK